MDIIGGIAAPPLIKSGSIGEPLAPEDGGARRAGPVPANALGLGRKLNM
jgi:hypothetical protein